MDLVKLPRGLGLSVAAEKMAEYVVEVCGDVKQMLEQINAKYKLQPINTGELKCFKREIR